MIGDIIRDNTLAKDVNTMIVIYENGGFFVDYSEEYKPLLAGVNHNCEVIGNVWENSDLLGEWNNGRNKSWRIYKNNRTVRRNI